MEIIKLGNQEFEVVENSISYKFKNHKEDYAIIMDKKLGNIKSIQILSTLRVLMDKKYHTKYNQIASRLIEKVK